MTPRSKLFAATLVVATALALAPGPLASDAPASAPSRGPAASNAPASTADHVQVQHILIGFQGSVPGKAITRSREESKVLADQILARAKKGEDFDALVKQFTDDSAPGIYGMSNTGVPPAPGEAPRKGMVKGFGDIGFSLKVAEIGRADYDPVTSPFGWHIIKRLK